MQNSTFNLCRVFFSFFCKWNNWQFYRNTIIVSEMSTCFTPGERNCHFCIFESTRKQSLKYANIHEEINVVENLVQICNCIWMGKVKTEKKHTAHTHTNTQQHWKHYTIPPALNINYRTNSLKPHKNLLEHMLKFTPLACVIKVCASVKKDV